MASEYEVFTKQIKDNISALIANEKLEEAKILLSEYKNSFDQDVECFSIEAIIYIKQDDLDKAITVLKAGLDLDKNNFDLNFNLAYIYEINSDYVNAKIYYSIAKNNSNGTSEQIQQIEQILNNLENIEKNIDFDLANSSIKKVLFIQNAACIRTNKVATALTSKGIQTDIIYLIAHPSTVYKDIELPYNNIYQLDDVNQMIEFINNSDYDILYSSNEPDYLTVLFTSTNKPIVHDTHDMMSLRSDISIEQLVFEYVANVKSAGNIYVNEAIRDIGIKRFDLKNKPVFTLHSYIEQEMLPNKYYRKLSDIDGEVHCVFEGGLASEPGHHRFLEPMILELAQSKVHVHLHCPVDPEYIVTLQKKSSYIHYEGILSPKLLIEEMTKYDIGLAIFNLSERNRTFLNTAFPNKIWDYLAAGLPILFANLTSFEQFAETSGVGRVFDFNGNIKKQIEELINIKVERAVLRKNKWLMNEAADNLIKFFMDVKCSYHRLD